MNLKTRIVANDTVQTAIIKLYDNNPGALSALIAISKESEKSDNRGHFGGFGPLLLLDALGIYGSEIWMLFKDACGQDARNTTTALRAFQLGILKDSEIKSAINGKTELDHADILSKVKQKLLPFGNS